MCVLSPLEVAKSCFQAHLRVSNLHFSLLASSTFKPFSKTNMSCFVPILMIESILVCCTHHIVKLANNRNKSTSVCQITYHVSRGRSLDWASGGAHFRTFPSRTQVPKLRQLWWWRTHGLWHELGVPKFFKNKIFRWRLCNLAKQSMFGVILMQNWFSKINCQIWTLWCLSVSHCTLWD
mgnify:CR=1 FL=1